MCEDVYDLRHPQDQTSTKLYDRGYVKLSTLSKNSNLKPRSLKLLKALERAKLGLASKKLFHDICAMVSHTSFMS